MAGSPPAPPEGTRSDLIQAGIRLFGRQGFAATSVRQLALEAKANIAAIAYHFGSKDGLRLACAEEFGRRMTAALATTPGKPDATPVDARAELRRIIRAMLGFLLGGKGASEVVPFMLRELAEDGPGIDAVYQGFAEPTHRRLCGLWAKATGMDPESETVRIAVFALIGQVIYCGRGHPMALRLWGWTAVGPTEIDLITSRIILNLDAMLDREKGG
jgi:AcrR family transcriptional regulator